MSTKTKVSKIEAELVKLTKLSRKEGESHQDWCVRLVRAAYKLPEEDFIVTDETFEWCETAIKAIKAKARIPLFDGSEDAGDDEDSDDAEADEPEAEAEDDGDDAEEDVEDEEPEEVPPPKAAPAAKKAEAPAKAAAPAKSTKPAAKVVEPEPDEEPKSAEDDTRQEVEKVSDEDLAEQHRPVKHVANSRSEVVDRHTAFRELVVANVGMPRDQLYALAVRRGIDLRPSSMSTLVYHTLQTVQIIERNLKVKLPRYKMPVGKVAAPKAEVAAPAAAPKRARTPEPEPEAAPARRRSTAD